MKKGKPKRNPQSRNQDKFYTDYADLHTVTDSEPISGGFFKKTPIQVVEMPVEVLEICLPICHIICGLYGCFPPGCLFGRFGCLLRFSCTAHRAPTFIRAFVHSCETLAVFPSAVCLGCFSRTPPLSPSQLLLLAIVDPSGILTSALQQTALQQGLHISAAIRNHHDKDLGSKHPVDDAIGLEGNFRKSRIPRARSSLGKEPLSGLVYRL